MEIFFLLNMIKRYEKRTQLEYKMLILIHNLIKQIILMDERFRVFQDTYNGALYFSYSNSFLNSKNKFIQNELEFVLIQL